MLSDVTSIVLTNNEAPNVTRTFDRLRWAKEILVIDSFSTDQTVELARTFPHARVLQRQFDSHREQWNFGLSEAKTDWVLTLDADYVLTDELLRELQSWQPEDGVVAYVAKIRYCIASHPLRRALYPPRAVLFHRDFCHYEQDGHTQNLKINGQVRQLKGEIFHDDHKPLSAFISGQNRYANLEADKLLNAKPGSLSLQDRIRQKIVIAPFLVFFYTLLRKGLILDGWPGLYYVFQRTLFEVVLSLYLLDGKWQRPGSREQGDDR